MTNYPNMKERIAISAKLNALNWCDPIDFSHNTIDEFEEWTKDHWIRLKAFPYPPMKLINVTYVNDQVRFKGINAFGVEATLTHKDVWQRAKE